MNRRIKYEVTKPTEQYVTYDEAMMYVLFYKDNGRGWRLPDREEWFIDKRIYTNAWYLDKPLWSDVPKRRVQLTRIRPIVVKLCTLHNTIKRAKEYVEYQLFKRVIKFFNAML
jgi:hypothetical protein